MKDKAFKDVARIKPLLRIGVKEETPDPNLMYTHPGGE